jgi:hypothetical protein
MSQEKTINSLELQNDLNVVHALFDALAAISRDEDSMINHSTVHALAMDGLKRTRAIEEALEDGGLIG